MFSDECSVERGAGKRRGWIWRQSGQRFDKDKVHPSNKSKDLRCMVFGVICDQECSDLIVMRRDMTSAVQSYTAESYIEALRFSLPLIWNPWRIFQQDGARIHTAKKTIKFLQQYNICWIEDWPPYSPDLNPIEHVWSLLKQRLYELFPDIENWQGPDESVIERMENALVYVWDTLDPQFIRNCVESMPKRYEAVVASGGQYMRY